MTKVVVKENLIHSDISSILNEFYLENCAFYKEESILKESLFLNENKIMTYTLHESFTDSIEKSVMKLKNLVPDKFSINNLLNIAKKLSSNDIEISNNFNNAMMVVNNFERNSKKIAMSSMSQDTKTAKSRNLFRDFLYEIGKIFSYPAKLNNLSKVILIYIKYIFILIGRLIIAVALMSILSMVTFGIASLASPFLIFILSYNLNIKMIDEAKRNKCERELKQLNISIGIISIFSLNIVGGISKIIFTAFEKELPRLTRNKITNENDEAFISLIKSIFMIITAIE